MQPDEGDDGLTKDGDGPFCDIAYDVTGNQFDYPDAIGVYRENITDKDGEAVPGFYSRVNDEACDTLFVRTGDRMPYACASFVIGHMQTNE